ncbi:hypothetical protein X757_20070 [Mesorhizobium sp. LSHC414A00]|nr:hypothetical protein X757_20070 [Mesorhizobium sp. LSHC414A00]
MRERDGDQRRQGLVTAGLRLGIFGGDHLQHRRQPFPRDVLRKAIGKDRPVQWQQAVSGYCRKRIIGDRNDDGVGAGPDREAMHDGARHEADGRCRKVPGLVFDAVGAGAAGPVGDLAHLRMLVRGNLAEMNVAARKHRLDMQEADIKRPHRLAIDKEIRNGIEAHGAGKSPIGFAVTS